MFLDRKRRELEAQADEEDHQEGIEAVQDQMGEVLQGDIEDLRVQLEADLQGDIEADQDLMHQELLAVLQEGVHLVARVQAGTEEQAQVHLVESLQVAVQAVEVLVREDTNEAQTIKAGTANKSN